MIIVIAATVVIFILSFTYLFSSEVGLSLSLIHLNIPCYFTSGFYDTRDHDRHHSHFDMNYGFPFPYLDILHGTYHGKFLNFDIQPFGKNK